MEQDFSELIKYLDEKFGDVDKRFEEIRSDFNVLQTAVDGYSKKADTYFQEMVMLAHKIDRHEKWIRMIFDKIGLKMEY